MMSFRFCRSRAIFTLSLTIYLVIIWIDVLAQPPPANSTTRQEFEREVAAATKINDISSELLALRESLKIMQELKIDQRLIRIEEAQQRSLAQTEKTARMISGIMICLMGFLLQQVWKTLTQKRVLEHPHPHIITPDSKT